MKGQDGRLHLTPTARPPGPAVRIRLVKASRCACDRGAIGALEVDLAGPSRPRRSHRGFGASSSSLANSGREPGLFALVTHLPGRPSHGEPDAATTSREKRPAQRRARARSSATRGSGSTARGCLLLAARDDQHDLIVAGRDEDPFWELSGMCSPSTAAMLNSYRDHFGTLPAQVPHEAMGAGLGRKAGLGPDPAFREVTVRVKVRRGLPAGEAARPVRFRRGSRAGSATLGPPPASNRSPHRSEGSCRPARRAAAACPCFDCAGPGMPFAVRTDAQARAQTAALISRSGATSSSTQIARPCVAAMRSSP